MSCSNRWHTLIKMRLVFYIKENNIFINCGIDINNYEKALAIIKEQLEDMEKGNFSIEDINNAKELLLSSLNSLEDEQINEISYYLTKELLNDNKTIGGKQYALQ